ncbi:MAG: response regulator transcription factor [Armatimonadota bacterium]
MGEVKVVVADDHTIVRQGLCSILNAHPDVEVVGEASDGREAVRLVDELQPDIVIMDIAMPQLNGLEATRQIASRHPDVRVLVLSMYTDIEHVVHALQAGACGYVRKEDADAELIDAIQSARLTEPYLSPATDGEAVREHLARAAKQDGDDVYDPLTPREREVLQLVAEGHPNKQIARILSIAVRTVEEHRAHIMRKLELTDQAGLVRYAIRRGIVSSDQ